MDMNKQHNQQHNQEKIQQENHNFNGIPHPPPLVFLGDGFAQLRRDWEHAFHVQSLQGRGTEHLQRLMHTQFTFLEHVVLDVSKQCHSLQDQLNMERSANSKLLNQIEEIQKTSAHIKGPIMELENKVMKLDASQQILFSQQKGLDVAINTHGAALKSKMNEKQSPETEIVSKMALDINSLQKEIIDLKSVIENEKQHRLADKSQLDITIEDLKKQIASIHLDIQYFGSSVLKETKDILHEKTNSFERHLLSHRNAHQNEQQTMLSVIKTMSTNISTLRKELNRLDSKSLAKIEEFKDLILAQFKQEIKTVTRPLIVH